MNDLNLQYTRRVYRKIKEMTASLNKIAESIKWCDKGNFEWMKKDDFESLKTYSDYFKNSIKRIDEDLKKLWDLYFNY